MGAAKDIFIGLENYRTMLHDVNFWIPLGRTFQVTVICIVAELLIGLGLGSLWNRDFRGQNIVRGLILLPLLIAPLILSIVWNFLLEYNIGFVNQIFSAIGISVRSSALARSGFVSHFSRLLAVLTAVRIFADSSKESFPSVMRRL